MLGLQGLMNEVPARGSCLLPWLPLEGLGDTSQLHILEEQPSEAFDDDDATRSSDTPNKVEEGSLTSRVFLPTSCCLKARVCDNKEVSGVEACESMDDDEDWSMYIRERLDEDKEEDEENKEEREEEIVEKRVPIPVTTLPYCTP